jgi:DNA-binding NarL/FixJ family response regulator
VVEQSPTRGDTDETVPWAGRPRSELTLAVIPQAGGSDAASGPDHRLGSSDPATRLTHREIEVLRLLALGRATFEPADRLSVMI